MTAFESSEQSMLPSPRRDMPQLMVAMLQVLAHLQKWGVHSRRCPVTRGPRVATGVEDTPRRQPRMIFATETCVFLGARGMEWALRRAGVVVGRAICRRSQSSAG